MLLALEPVAAHTRVCMSRRSEALSDRHRLAVAGAPTARHAFDRSIAATEEDSGPRSGDGRSIGRSIDPSINRPRKPVHECTMPDARTMLACLRARAAGRIIVRCRGELPVPRSGIMPEGSSPVAGNFLVAVDRCCRGAEIVCGGCAVGVWCVCVCVCVCAAISLKGLERVMSKLVARTLADKRRAHDDLEIEWSKSSSHPINQPNRHQIPFHPMQAPSKPRW